MTYEEAAKLTDARRSAGYTREQAAKQLGLTEETLRTFETAEAEPDPDQRRAMDALYAGTQAETDGRALDEKRARFPYPLVISALYLVLGCCFGLWHPGWILFLTIPLYYVPDQQRGWLRTLGNPVMVTIIYLLLGFCCNLWHPGWLVFLLIPILGALEKDR